LHVEHGVTGVATRQEVVQMPTGDEIATSRQPIRPSRVWYWVAGAALVGSVGLGLSLLLGFGSFARQVEELQRVPIPGEAEVSFDKAGGYTVYFEGMGAADEQVTIPPFNVYLIPVGGGEVVSIRPYADSESYSIGGRSGRAVGTFQIDEPGRFLLRAEGEPQAIQAGVAVGPSTTPAVFRALFLVLPAGFILFVGGVVLAVVVAVRRDRARRALLAPAIQSGTGALGAVPAGWFADPSRRHELRYWDGQRWTEQVSDRGTQTVDPV
jgi:Protein of unknown function (DUF2510)